jgi:hypothetical protein
MKLPKRTLLDEIRYYGFYCWINYLDMLPRRIYWFFQRGYRGYGDNDIWDFDYYLATIISKGLKQLKKYHHGYEPTEKELDIIIKGFEANLKLMDCNFNPKGKDYVILQVKFHKAMILFEKYFNYLWD